MGNAPKSQHDEDEGNPCGVPEKLHAAISLLQEKWVLSIVYVLLTARSASTKSAAAPAR